MAQRRSRNGSNGNDPPLVTSLTVKGFKSFAKEQGMEIRPLTILAGANSSGKSSMIQPALLIKQTLESPYDPGALRIDGPNVGMTEFNQLFWGTGTTRLSNSFVAGFGMSDGSQLELRFATLREGLDVTQMRIENGSQSYVIRPRMSEDEIRDLNPEIETIGGRLKIQRDRCFLLPAQESPGGTTPLFREPIHRGVFTLREFTHTLLHVPGLRPAQRIYPRASVAELPGTFESYFASILNHWKRNKRPELEDVGRDLEHVGVTWKVDVREVGDIGLEIFVGRLPHSKPGGASDLVNIADVGFGVSQVLPAVVALWTAEKGDTVFVEQPEVHLHPRAQVRMAKLFANAAKRGIRVIVETHSALLLRGIQTLVAQGDLSPDDVKLHWFERDDRDGATKVTPADLGKDGSFGDWPEDFNDVAIDSARQYLDAADARSR